MSIEKVFFTSHINNNGYTILETTCHKRRMLHADARLNYGPIKINSSYCNNYCNLYQCTKDNVVYCLKEC